MQQFQKGSVDMRRIALLLTLLLLLCCAVAAAEEEPATIVDSTGNYEYILLEDGSAEIVDYVGSAEELEVPAELDGHPVTSIGDEAFSGCDCVTSVTIPGGVISIGNGAFSECDNLSSITLPDGVTSIGDEAFSGCSLTRITLPDSITFIGANPFRECLRLRTIHVSSDHPVLAVVDGVLFEKTSKTLVCYPCGLTATE